MDATDPATGALRLRRRVPPDGPLPDYSASARAAVFLDFENLVLGAGAGLPGQSDPVPADALTLLCRGFYGNAAIRRAWAQTTLLNDVPAMTKAEPKTLRYRLLHLAARLVRGGRRLRLRLDRPGPGPLTSPPPSNAALACPKAAR